MDVTSLRQRLRRVPAPVVDAGLAVALAVAITMTQPAGVRFERLGAVTLKGIASPLLLNEARFA